MNYRCTVCVMMVLFPTATLGAPNNKPPEIPSHLKAVASNHNFSSAKTVTVAVENRRSENPDTYEDLERLRNNVLKIIPKLSYTLASVPPSADLSLDLLIEPNVRYGLFHYQNAPYVYLLLRETNSGDLVYCAYQRASHFFSASERLLDDLEQTSQGRGLPPSGTLTACAEQAMRPLSIHHP